VRWTSDEEHVAFVAGSTALADRNNRTSPTCCAYRALDALGAVSGVLAECRSDVLMERLDRITEFRLEHGWLLFLLPAAGPVIGFGDHYLGGRSGQGNALLIDQIHEPTGWVPRRTAPPVLAGTWVTHLFGGSAGREAPRCRCRAASATSSPERCSDCCRGRTGGCDRGEQNVFSMPFGRAPTEIYG